MARVIPQNDPMAASSKTASFMVFFLFFLVSMATLALVVMFGVKQKATGKAKKVAGRGVSPPGRARAEIEEEDHEYQLQAKRRTRAEINKKKEVEWKEGMPGRTFKNERQVDLDSLAADFPGMQTIMARGMRFWFNPLNGFNKKAVVEFYQKMQISLDIGGSGFDEIRSKVGGRNVVVTVDRIARYMGYIRPSNIDYPGLDTPTLEEVVAELYEDTADYKGSLRPGFFKEEYRLLNKVIQYNLFPRSSGHRLTKEGAELLYMFKRTNVSMDCASWVFTQLVDFKAKAIATSNIPFPCMITYFCRDSGITGGEYEEMEALNPGPIDKQGMSKSRSLSKPTTVEAGPSQPAPKPKATIKSLLKRIFCNQVEIRKENKEMSKRQVRMGHEVAWQTAQIEKQSGVKYVPPEEDEEEEDEEEEEMPLMSDSDE